MSAADRLREYLRFKGINNSQAEIHCGLSNGYVSSSKSMGSDKLEKILNTYHDLSAEWLMRGIGSMLVCDKPNAEQVFKVLNMPTNSDKIIDVWMKFMELTQGMQDIYRQATNINQKES